MSLKIIKAGIADTIQDHGRQGFRHWGINPGGAMDLVSAQIANALVGNACCEAVMELYFPASAFLFEKPALIALTGGNFSATINDQLVENMRPVLIPAGSRLCFTRIRSGTIAYMAISGGLQIESWLNSYSTNLRANAGGWYGRRLQKGDELQFKKPISINPSQYAQLLFWHKEFTTRNGNILCIAGQ